MPNKHDHSPNGGQSRSNKKSVPDASHARFFAIQSIGGIQKIKHGTLKDKQKVDIPEAPDWLSPHSKDLWSRWVRSRIKSAGKIELLRVGLELLDRADSWREVINKEGFTVISNRGKMPHNHPLLREELNCRKLFHKIMRNLHLDWEFSEDVPVNLATGDADE